MLSFTVWGILLFGITVFFLPERLSMVMSLRSILNWTPILSLFSPIHPTLLSRDLSMLFYLFPRTIWVFAVSPCTTTTPCWIVFFLNLSKDFFANWSLLKVDLKKNVFRKILKKKNTNPFVTESNLPTFRSTVAQRCNGFFQSVILRRFSGDFPRSRYTLCLKRLNSGSVTPSLVGFYVLSKLRSVFPIKSVLTKLIRYFHFNNRYAGVSIKVSGRFSRAEMASSRVETFGKVSLSTKGQLVDYGVASVPLKYGTTGVKVWLNLVY